jgi:hypothetical protein
METNFVMFGCWNNLNIKKGKEVGCLKKVMNKLNEYVIEKKINNIIVAGDNYYPDKNESEGIKAKIIYIDKLFEGFSTLPKNINIDMIFGNHDLETNLGTENDNLYIYDDKKSEFIKEDTNCEITKYEMEAIRQDELNINLKLFNIKHISENTLMVLLDTSIYSDDANKFMKCYNYFLGITEGISFSTLNELKEFQEKHIKDEIFKLKDNIQNLIIVGHHPIAGFKTKTKQGKKKLVEMNDIINIIPLLKEIYSILGEKKYYYLCADYHSYQKGLITLDIEDGNEMKIEQYIVGTGGTKLDDELLSDINPSYYDEDQKLNYKMKINEQDCGFLACNINEEVVFEPILLGKSIGGKTKKRRRKLVNKKKTRKHSKRIK